MKNKLTTLALVVGSMTVAQAQQFNGTVFDLDTGRTQVIQGQINDRNRAHRERMARYEQMNAELSASINSMRAEAEMERQTRELRKQTELLRKIADQ
jgi:hypothetical protein